MAAYVSYCSACGWFLFVYFLFIFFLFYFFFWVFGSVRGSGGLLGVVSGSDSPTPTTNYGYLLPSMVARRNVPSGMRGAADMRTSMRQLGRVILWDNISKTGDGPEIISTTYGTVGLQVQYWVPR